MRIIRYKQKNFRKVLESLYSRQVYPDDIEQDVKKILDDIKQNGNSAICRYALEFDNVKLSPSLFRVTEKEIIAAGKKLDTKTKKLIDKAIDSVSIFARKRIPKPWSFRPRPGVIVGEKFEPLDRIGVYIPGGTAPLVSTVVHTVAIAKTAGVKKIAATTPPGKNGEIFPGLLYALYKSGANEIYRLGGVYGIGAFAYGTETIKKVEKIVGPGNAYVTAAKKLVYGEVSLDMPAGPSEIMIIADTDSNPEFIAADLLSQAEHGSGREQAVLLCNSYEYIKTVSKTLKKQAVKLQRSKHINNVLENGVFLIEVKDISQAAEIAGLYAPEHLEIICRQPEAIVKKVKSAGAIFLGEWTPEAVGDFVAGPSHVLPTGGTARYFSGLTVEQFFRRTSIINYRKSALKNELPIIQKFAEMEGLDAHAKSASIRIDKK